MAYLERMPRMAELAARPCGVASAHLAAEWCMPLPKAAALLSTAARRKGWVHCKRQGLPVHYFVNPEDAKSWMAAEVAPVGTATMVPRIPPVARNSPRPGALQVRRALPQPTPAAAPALLSGEPVITSATKVTVYERAPQGYRIDLMADPVRPIPGWGGPPPRRAGSMDYRQHQAHSREGSQP